MNITVNGVYKLSINYTNMFTNTTIEKVNHNLITQTGVAFILNSLINQQYDYIDTLALGWCDDVPNITDDRLGDETYTCKPVFKTDIMERCLSANADINVRDFENVSEIGLKTNTGLLVTHDSWEAFDIPGASNIKITYKLFFNSESTLRGWTPDPSLTSVYLTSLPVQPVLIYNSTTGDGLTQVYDMNDLTQNTYYYNTRTGRVFVHLINDENPNNMKLIYRSI